MNNGTGIEFVWVTPAEIGVAVLVGFLLVGLAFVAGVWAMRGAPADVQDEVEAGADPEETVEIRPRRRRPLSPGTICAPGVKVPPDPTITLDASAVRDAR